MSTDFLTGIQAIMGYSMLELMHDITKISNKKGDLIARTSPGFTNVGAI